VFPSHAELQAEAFAASDATLNPKLFLFTIETPTRETFHRAKATVKTIDHPLNSGIRGRWEFGEFGDVEFGEFGIRGRLTHFNLLNSIANQV
jgi:hypothetical protein